MGVSSIEVTDGNIKSFERVARKYNVDFAVKKDKTTNPPKYVVFFKGRDADAVAQAFKEFVYGNEKRKGRTSVREKLKRFRDAVSQNKNRERSREKNKDRGQTFEYIIEGITKDLKEIPKNLKAKAGGMDTKKLVLLNLLYIFAGYFCDKVAWLWRVSEGTNM